MMKFGSQHRCLILSLTLYLCGQSVATAADDGEFESTLGALFSPAAESAVDSRSAEVHDEDFEHGTHVEFRILPDKQYSPPTERAKRLPPPPGSRILDPADKILKLVLLLRFKGHQDRELPTQETYNIIFNKVGGHPEYARSGSALDYSREVSYGKMSIHTQVVGWIDLPETEQYYANGKSGDFGRIADAIRYALDHADRNELIDFGDFDRNGDEYVDLFSVIHSGYGAEFPDTDAYGSSREHRIWSHQSRIPVWTSNKSQVRVSDYSISTGLRDTTGSKPCRIGLLAHETAHLGGLPDLYDGRIGRGIGSWGLLGFAEGFSKSGHTPTHFTPWAKYKLGWLKLKDLTEPGVHKIKEVENFPDVYRIKEGFPEGEYLLIENRQPVGFDSELPGEKGGLAIWHIDENKKHNRQPGHPGITGWPNNNAHYMVAMLQADGRFDLERGSGFGDENDLFRSDGVNRISSHDEHGLRPYRVSPTGSQVLHTISEISEPGKVMSFRYDVKRTSTPPTPPPPPTEPISKLPPGPAGGTPPVGPKPVSTSAATVPIAGATVSFADFSHEDRKQLAGDGILLEATIELSNECVVHIRGNASVTSKVPGTSLATGVSGDGSPSPRMWKHSVRLATISASNKCSSLIVNCRRRLPPGAHVIRWVVKSQNALQFPGGGVLMIQAYPCPPRN